MMVDPHEKPPRHDDLSFTENSVQMNAALVEVSACAYRAVERLNRRGQPWQNSEAVIIDNERVVIVHLGTRQALYLGSNGRIYRKEPDGTYIDAPIGMRRTARDVRDLKKYLNALGT